MGVSGWGVSSSSIGDDSFFFSFKFINKNQLKKDLAWELDVVEGEPEVVTLYFGIQLVDVDVDVEG